MSGPRPTRRASRLTVAIVTGTRAEFGLLRPVMDAVKKHPRLKLKVIVAGAHFLPPARTISEVKAAYPIAAEVRMQRPGKTGRAADAAALGRGVSGFAGAFAKLKPDWVVVLGDRIEAFAAASAASIAGIAVCHIHGGDRAEGIADEAMRHAITKLAHLHCAATTLSAERIRQMGERADLVHVTGSPAIDGLRAIRPMGDRDAAKLGDPKVIVLMHPAGLSIEEEWEWPITVATVALSVTGSHFRMRSKGLPRTLVLAPNSDPGSEITARCLNGTLRGQDGVEFRDHLPRSEFLALLQRLRNGRGVLLGNSSAALIEAAALRVAAVNFGPRQSGRERGANIVDVTWPDLSDFDAIERLLRHAISGRHPYGDGRAGPRIAALLAKVDPHDSALLRKRNVY